MSEAREVVLGRIRAALADGPPVPAVPRGYVMQGASPAVDVVARFVARVEETGATIVAADVAAAAISAALSAQRASRVVVATDLGDDLRPVGIEVVEDAGLAPGELDALDGAVTTCAAACADTGTIALDGGPGQGRRAITLVPDLHVCVVRHGQVVETVPELFDRLAPAARQGRPIVLVSGPSATSDIGFERVEGVHGPRRLVVVLVP